MKKLGLQSCYTIAHYKVHRSKSNESEMGNTLNRAFEIDNPHTAIVSDLTYVKVGKKWHYLCVLLDKSSAIPVASTKRRNWSWRPFITWKPRCHRFIFAIRTEETNSTTSWLTNCWTHLASSGYSAPKTALMTMPSPKQPSRASRRNSYIKRSLMPKRTWNSNGLTMSIGTITSGYTAAWTTRPLSGTAF